jgi:hypothetical protein
MQVPQGVLDAAVAHHCQVLSSDLLQLARLAHVPRLGRGCLRLTPQSNSTTTCSTLRGGQNLGGSTRSSPPRVGRVRGAVESQSLFYRMIKWSRITAEMAGHAE